MKQEKKEWFEGNIGYILFVIFVVVVLISSVIFVINVMGSDDERITINDKIVNVKLIEDDDTYYDVLELTFTKGEKYLIENINMVDYDFTVNSKFIIKLYREDSDSYWTITKMYKVPDGNQ